MTTTKLNDLFDKLEPEKGNKLDERMKLEEIDLDFEHLIHVAKNDHCIYHDGTVIDYFRRNITKAYTSGQITKFSAKLTDELVDAIGSIRTRDLLNHLVNDSEDSTYLIFTDHLNEKLDFLGNYLENKTLHIHGDAGDYVGYGMKSGKITVEGNCGYSAGISIKDGKLVIKGNAGSNLGEHMGGGIVEVHGDITSISNWRIGGDIYHRNKLIVKNGEILDRSYKID